MLIEKWHKHFINIIESQGLIAIVLMSVLLLVSGCQGGGDIKKKSSHNSAQVNGTQGYIDERNKPVVPYTGAERTGAEVYALYCATCHDRTTQGAPLPDDDIEWLRRLKKGKEILVKNVLNGYKELMPVKGGCRNCSEKEVRAAVDYIFMRSGIKNTE